MGSLSLLWRFLGEQPAELLFALVPWHLVAVLVVLGLFAGLGAQYLLDVRLGWYGARGHSNPWLALPSLLVLLVAVLVLLFSYGLAARAPALVQLTAGDADDPTLRDNIGRALLAPVLAQDELATDQGAVAKDILVNAILATPHDHLRNAYAASLSAAQATLRALEHMERSESSAAPKPGQAAPEDSSSEPDGAQGDTPRPAPPASGPPGSGAAAAPTVSGGTRPTGPPVDASQAGQGAAPAAQAHGQDTGSAGSPAQSAAPTAPAAMAQQPPSDAAPAPAQDQPARTAAPDPAAEGRQMAGPAMGSADDEDPAGETAVDVSPGEVPMTGTLERLTLLWLTSADAPGDFAPVSAGNQTGASPAEAGMPEFLVALVDEIRDGVTLEREGWEHIAGSRFVEDVLSPWLSGQLRYLAGLVALIVVVFLAVYFFLLKRLVHWLNGTAELTAVQSQSAPQAGQHEA